MMLDSVIQSDGKSFTIRLGGVVSRTLLPLVRVRMFPTSSRALTHTKWEPSLGSTKVTDVEVVMDEFEKSQVSRA
jgi:hypothetical protein